MINWGYTVSTDNQIDYDHNDQSIADLIRISEPSFDVCIGCGTCTATCTTSQFTDYNFRKLLVLIKRGEMVGLKKEISKCMMCGKCQLICPRGVNTRNIIRIIQKAIN
jgi:heterodisulfide reductase subunit C